MGLPAFSPGYFWSIYPMELIIRFQKLKSLDVNQSGLINIVAKMVGLTFDIATYKSTLS